MTTNASTIPARPGEFITERATRRVRKRPSQARRPTLLRRWSVAELIAEAAARPRQPAAV